MTVALATLLALAVVVAAWCWWAAWSSTSQRDALQARLDHADDGINRRRYYSTRYFGANVDHGMALIREELEKHP